MHKVNEEPHDIGELDSLPPSTVLRVTNLKGTHSLVFYRFRRMHALVVWYGAFHMLTLSSSV